MLSKFHTFILKHFFKILVLMMSIFGIAIGLGLNYFFGLSLFVCICSGVVLGPHLTFVILFAIFLLPYTQGKLKPNA